MKLSILKALELAERILQRDGLQQIRGEAWTDNELEAIQKAIEDTKELMPIKSLRVDTDIDEDGEFYLATCKYENGEVNLCFDRDDDLQALNKRLKKYKDLFNPTIKYSDACFSTPE